jgi:hypothetical protein
LPVWRGQPTDADHVEDIMPKTTARAPSLHQLAEQSEDIKELMERCATDLSRVNSGIAQELHDHGALPAVERALSKNLKIEDGVGEACEKLAVVTTGWSTRRVIATCSNISSLPRWSRSKPHAMQPSTTV